MFGGKAIPGDYKVQCDRTGEICLRSECEYEWNGLLVKKDVWRRKHPGDDPVFPLEQPYVIDARPPRDIFMELPEPYTD